jgi:hypothetical protein
MRHGIFFFFIIGWLCSAAITPARAQWEQTNGSFGSWDVSYFTANSNILFCATDESGVYSSTDSGSNWVSVNYGIDADNLFAIGVSGSNVFAGTDGGLYFSTDNGASWGVVDAGPAGLEGTVTAFMIIDTNIFAGTYGEGVSLSTDTGTSWKSASFGLSNGRVHSFARIDTNIFAGTDSGVFLTTNNGISWASVNNGLENKNVNAIASIGTNLFAGSGYLGDIGIFRSTDNGITWVTVDSGMKVTSFVVSGKNIFAATWNKGVFLSSDSGTSWAQVNTGMGDESVFGLFVTDADIFAGASNVYRRPLSDFNQSSVARPTIPSNSLSLNSYPNPFPQSSTITFSCASSGVGEVTIVNLLGTTVARLFSGELGAGEHSFSWDASQEAAGMYECVVRVGGSVQRIPLAFIK